MTSFRQVVCAHCDSLVRVPAERIAERPRCPRCHEALFKGQPIQSDGRELRPARREQRRAGRGRLLGAVVRALPRDGARVRAGRRRVEPNGALREAQHRRCTGYRRATTASAASRRLMVFKGGRETARQPGAMNAGSFDRWLQVRARCDASVNARLRRRLASSTRARAAGPWRRPALRGARRPP